MTDRHGQQQGTEGIGNDLDKFSPAPTEEEEVR